MGSEDLCISVTSDYFPMLNFYLRLETDRGWNIFIEFRVSLVHFAIFDVIVRINTIT